MVLSSVPSSPNQILAARPLTRRLGHRFHTMPSKTREMTLPHLGFVGGLLYAVRRAGRAPPPEPPDHLRCPISCDLFSDPVLLSQIGHTYDRNSIERWLRQKSPPTDPSSNVELRSTATVPNWALRDAVNEWRGSHNLPLMDAPECATRRLAGGANARDDGLMGFPGFGIGNLRNVDGTFFVLRPVRVAVLSLLVAITQLLTSVLGALFSLIDGVSRRFLRNLGVPPNAAAHVAAFSMLAFACGCTASMIILLEGVVQGSEFNKIVGEISHIVAPAQNALWWAGVFSAVWLANGGFVDPIRADAERRAARDLRRGRNPNRHDRQGARVRLLGIGWGLGRRGFRRR